MARTAPDPGRGRPERRRRSRSIRPQIGTAALEARTLLAATIIDNGAPGYTASTSFFNQQNVTDAFENDVAIATKGTGSLKATWRFEGLTPGLYRVAATWPGQVRGFVRATDAPYSVFDGDTLLSSVDVNQSVAPNDFTDSGVGWEDLGGGNFFQLTGSTLVVTLNNQADNNVYADAVRIESAVQPLIEVTVDGSPVEDNTGSVSFGQTSVPNPITRTFTVRNVGAANLSLSGLQAPAGFSVASNFGTSSVAPGASTTFAIRMDAATTGTFNGQVSFTTNVVGKNPFNFAVTGVADESREGPAASVSVNNTIVPDNGSYSFGVAAPGSTRQRTFTVKSVGTETLNLTGPISLPPGFTLVSGFGDTSLAPGESTTFTVGLQTASVGFFSGQLSFATNDPIQNPYNFTISGSVGNVTATPQIGVFDGTTPIANGTGVVDLGVTLLSSPLVKVITITNTGLSPLNLTSTPTLPAGFSLLSNYTLTTIETGEVSAFTVLVDASAPGLFSGPVSFTSDDPDESPFVFTISVLVSATEGPDIQVLEGSNELVDKLSLSNFGVVQPDTQVVKTYTIRNMGAQPLNLGAISLPAGFVLQAAPVTTTLNPAQSTTFSIRFITANVGTFAGPVLINSNDSDENPFRFNVTGQVTAVPVADLDVFGPGGQIFDAASTVEFGTTTVGSPLVRTFSVTNTGTTTLVLFGLTGPSGFSVASSFGQQAVAPGATTTFSIRLNATTAGLFAGTLRFGTNATDPDKRQFSFQIRGTVQAAAVPGSGPDRGIFDAALQGLEAGPEVTWIPLESVELLTTNRRARQAGSQN